MFLENGSTFRPIDNASMVHNLDSNAVYLLQADMVGFYLTKTDSFKLPTKIYGNANEIAERVLKRKNITNKSIGVALTGLKGSGKSLTAKLISIKSNMPTIIINSVYTGTGFENLISSLSKETPIVVLFDEFEKVYKDKEEEILSLLDGTINHNCIFIFTTNSKYNQYLENRLSRIHYHIEYESLDKKVMSDIIDDLLINKEYKPELLSILEFIDPLNLDLLVCFISEINMFNQSPATVLPYLNISIESIKYDFKIFVGTEEIKIYNPQINANLFLEPFSFEMSTREFERLKPILSDEDYLKLSKLEDEYIDLVNYSFLKENDTFIFKIDENITFIFEKVKNKTYQFPSVLF